MKIEILCKNKPAESINHMMLDFYRISYAIKSCVVEENSGLTISGLSIHTESTPIRQIAHKQAQFEICDFPEKSDLATTLPDQ